MTPDLPDAGVDAKIAHRRMADTMLSRIAKLLLTSTAIAPVLLVYSWVAYQESGLSVVAHSHIDMRGLGHNLYWYSELRQETP